MKKLLTLFVAAAITFQLSAQTKVQRLVLLEEFTNASCGPCASQNPGLNTLLGNNEDKVVAIKYQTNWPGTDPMNAQTQTWAGPRVTYYSCDGVPYGRTDGVEIVNDCGGYDGAPGCLSQTDIDAAYAVPASFTMDVNHYLSADMDSIYLHVLITATEAFTGTTVKARIAVVEDEITFTTAPGSNGEKIFHDVMRVMYPDAAGISMASTWAAGDTVNIYFARALPTYIYNKAEIAVVAFLQDDANKNVLQAGYSQPTPLAYDAAITGISNVDFMTCATTFTPSFTFKNVGQTTLTEATISYKIDNGTPVNYNWTGSLALGQSEVVTLPQQTGTAGSHTLTIEIVDVNTTTDLNPSNDSKVANFSIVGAAVNIPVTEGFTNTAFPPANWINHDAGGDGYGWSRKTGAGGFGNSTACAKQDFYNSTSGNIDDLYTPPFSLTGVTEAYLVFNVAYAQYDATYSDRMQVQISTDCGANWTTVWDKAGTTLATASNTTSAFTPTSAQWRNESINLSNYLGQSDVMARFHAMSGYGNNLYIDDVNISNSSTDIENINFESSIEIYPNPAQNVLNISNVKNTEIVISDVTGRILMQLSNEDEILSINLNSFSDGTYFVSIKGNSTIVNKKFVVNK